MVRDGHQNPTVLARCLIHLRQDFGVFLYVLQDVEGPDYVKFFRERNSSSIHLKQLDSGQALRSDPQPCAEYFGAVERGSGVGFLDTRWYEAGSTNNFQQR